MTRWVSLSFVAVALPLAGCTTVQQDKDKVLAAIDATTQLSRSYTYSTFVAGHTTVVSGTIQDDFRYQVDEHVDGTAVASEVVSDDSRAVRLTASAASAMARAEGGNPTAAASLRAGQWLLDPSGAGSLTEYSTPVQPGADPLADSLTVLTYVRTAVIQAKTVQQWNPQSENYRPKLDVFPPPASGAHRYDLVPPDLPARVEVGTGNVGVRNTVPNTPFFRLMAIYVKDGLVQQIREQIAVEPRLLDSESNLEARLGDYVQGVSADAPVSQQVSALLRAINHQLSLEGQPLVRPGTMSLTFSGLGNARSVSLPATATQVDLSSLGSYGLLLFENH